MPVKRWVYTCQSVHGGNNNTVVSKTFSTLYSSDKTLQKPAGFVKFFSLTPLNCSVQNVYITAATRTCFVNEYVEGLFSKEAQRRSSDNGKVEDLDTKMRLPAWFDEDKYNQGRRLFWDFCFTFGLSMTLGVVAVFSIPSILKILVGTRRSNSTYTSYKRYVSTLMHVFTWYTYELKPGTKAWRSLQAVRSRHLQAGTAASLKGLGTVSQRDMALTQFGFIGFAVLKPDKFSIRQIKEGDWEGYNHFWRTIGHMIGIEDRYNLCRKNIDETREACSILLERVYTPCLENVPEYFEHMARAMAEGLATIVGIESTSLLFMTRYFADVPGYVYTEADRIAFQSRLNELLYGKTVDIGIDTANLIPKSAVDGLPKRPPRFLYVREFDTFDTTPGYKQLNFAGRYRLAVLNVIIAIYNTDVGRYFFNLLYRWNVFMGFNFPYKAFLKFGFKNSFVNMFVEDPKDDTEPKPNSEYEKPPLDTWYGKLYTILW